MGQSHKLLLPWKEAGTTIIDAVLAAWTRSQVAQVVVVARQGDVALQTACQKWPVDVVLPQIDPPDMRTSIQQGIEHLAAKYRPHSSDRWLIAPADVPTLSAELIDRLVAASASSPGIVAPRFGDRSGHPVSFPWSLSPTLQEIPADRGLDWLLESLPVDWLSLPLDLRLEDIDTPLDYQRLNARRLGR